MDTVIGIKFRNFVLLSAAGLAAHYYIKITDKEDKMTSLDPHKIIVCSGEDSQRKNFTDYVKCNLKLNTIRDNGLVIDTPAAASFIREELASAIRSRGGAYEVNTLLAGFDVPPISFFNNVLMKKGSGEGSVSVSGEEKGRKDGEKGAIGEEKEVKMKPATTSKSAVSSGNKLVISALNPDSLPGLTHLFYLDYLGTCQSVPYACHGYGGAFVTALLDRYYRADMSPQEGIDLLQMCVDEVKRRVIISTPYFISRVITRDGIEVINVH